MGRRASTPWLAAAALVVGLAATGCSDDQRPVITFAPSSTPSAPNLVRLAARGVDGDVLVLDVVIVGDTSSSELFAFDFGLEIGNRGMADFIDNSEVAGALMLKNCPASTAIVTRQPSGDLFVSVSKLGAGCSGSRADAPQETIVSLSFLVFVEGDTTVRLANRPSGPPAAFNPVPQEIPSVTFDLSPAFISKR